MNNITIQTFFTCFHKFFDSSIKLRYERNNISELARELGIKSSLSYKWRKDYQKYGSNSFPGKGNFKLTPKQDRIVELEKKLKGAELEQKAISIFFKNGRLNIDS